VPVALTTVTGVTVLSLDDRVDDLLGQLTLQEKLSMLDGDTAFWTAMIDTVRDDAYHRHPWPAGVVERLGVGGLHFVDGPRGVVLEGGATTFPAAIARGATFDTDLEERIGHALGREVRAVGANLFGGVCVNLLRHPGWGRAQETYGEDPVHLAAFGAAVVRGVAPHAIACVKHYALNSIDSARFRVDVQAGARVLHEVYLPHFRACVDAGAMSVMSGYNKVNGDWCAQSRTLLTDILKDRWGFDGFVLTDFIFGVHDGAAALNAGLDLEMPMRLVLDADLPGALERGEVPLARVDDAVARMLRAQLALPDGSCPAYAPDVLGSAEHRALAREAAQKSIVALKNDDALLPLPDTGTIAVVGALADQATLGDRGSSDTRPQSVVTPLAGLKQAAPDARITYSTGADQQQAAALAAAADAAVVVVGLSWRNEGEHIEISDVESTLRRVPPPDPLRRRVPAALLTRLWAPLARGFAAVAARAPSGSAAGTSEGFTAGDRTNLRLDPRDEALVRAVAAANPRTVVVLTGGGAIITEAWRHDVPAILLLWYPGMEGGHALADVVFGRVSASGRMPFTVPTDHAHLPSFDPRATSITYDLWHGYRLANRDGHRAAFPFGHGLSYSTFAYSDLAVRPMDAGVEVTVTVRNTGGMRAGDVVQVYAEPPGVAVERPSRALAGFARVELEPGEQARACVVVPWRTLAYFDEAADAFVLESGPHTLAVCRDAQATAAEQLTLEVTGRVVGP
jgi:beta-glucosidase